MGGKPSMEYVAPENFVTIRLSESDFESLLETLAEYRKTIQYAHHPGDVEKIVDKRLRILELSLKIATSAISNR